MANIVPIFKKGDRSLPANYRPVSLAEGNQVDVILLDFSKAFDKVAHQRLLHKLHYYRVRNSTLG